MQKMFVQSAAAAALFFTLLCPARAGVLDNRILEFNVTSLDGQVFVTDQVFFDSSLDMLNMYGTTVGGTYAEVSKGGRKYLVAVLTDIEDFPFGTTYIIRLVAVIYPGPPATFSGYGTVKSLTGSFRPFTVRVTGTPVRR